MPKNIQLSDDVYRKLEVFRGKRETFSEAVGRLLALLEKVGELRTILEGQIEFRKQKMESFDAVRTATLERADLESRKLDAHTSTQETVK